MLSLKENSEALGNFSEQLDIEGRSLWQDARRRFTIEPVIIPTNAGPIYEITGSNAGFKA